MPMGGKVHTLAQLRHAVETIFRKGIDLVSVGDTWTIEENASGQLEISNGTNTFTFGTFGGNTLTTDANLASNANGFIYGGAADVFRATGLQAGRNGPVNLSGVVGDFDGEIRVDDGTNTVARGVACVWDGTNSVWRPSNDPSTGSFV